jgi:outer membrane protein assembly factor BamE (lipoprotein component of BamABCDE complex)
MKKKLLIMFSILFVVVIVSGCGLYGVKNSSTGHYITKSQISKVKMGTDINGVIAKFGKPTMQKNGSLYYCGSYSNGQHFLFGLVNTGGKNSKCAIFEFKNNKLIKKY